jgi:nucleoside-diphosphate-sugar epimerase
VSGRAEDIRVSEETVCVPYDAYEKEKFALENLIINKTAESNIETIIVRPSCVFGSGGQNLLKLANDLTQDGRLKRYLKSCLFSKRKVNLVPVETVVSAIEFLVLSTMINQTETFIVADDEDPENNYWSVEELLIDNLGLDRLPIAHIQLPKWVLSILLRLANRSNFEPQRIYSSAKLRRLGWLPAIKLSVALQNFAEHYKKL